MATKTKTASWPKPLIDAVRAELQGNARRDLLGWAHRTNDAPRSHVSRSDLERARLVLDVAAGAV